MYKDNELYEINIDKLAKSIPGIKEVSWKIDQEQIEYLKEELSFFESSSISSVIPPPN